jgi:hypothetical protein
MKTIFLLFLLSTFAFSCGGCVDSAAAKAGSETIKRTYDLGDKALAKALDELIGSVNKVMSQEVINSKRYTENTQFNMDSLEFLKRIKALNLDKTDIISKGKK